VAVPRHGEGLTRAPGSEHNFTVKAGSDPGAGERTIVHIDMDAFYASIELRERPELVGRPVAVGGRSRRGVLTTANYEARQYGVKSAMPVFQALRLCPQLVCLPVRFDLYREESRRIRGILEGYTPLVEPLSLDEAYLDVSQLGRDGAELALEIRTRILDRTGLTASAGIAPNKMLAKIASDWRKPNGQFRLRPPQVPAFLRELPVRKLWGVGPRSAERLKLRGIHTCGQLQAVPLPELQRQFGRFGYELYQLARGHDERPVKPDRVRKSLSNERTYSDDLPDPRAAEVELDKLVGELTGELALNARERAVKTLVLKLKFSDFQQTTIERPGHAPNPVAYRQLLYKAWPRGQGKPVRLIGAGVRFAEEKTGDAVAMQLDLAL